MTSTYMKPNTGGRLWRIVSRLGPLGSFGLVVLIVFLLFAAVPDLFATHDPLDQNVIERLKPPSATYILGTDELGRDVYSRAVHGARTSIIVAIVAVLSCVVIGVPLGLLSGSYGGKIDEIFARANDIFVSFPDMVVAMAIIAVLGQNMVVIGFVIGLVRVPVMYRVTRAITLKVKVLAYVDAVRSAGASRGYILFRTILPSCTNEIRIQSLLVASRAIVVEASLSFLGIGTPPPAPSWGAMLSTAQNYLYQSVWYGFFPGLFIVVLVLSLQFVSKVGSN